MAAKGVETVGVDATREDLEAILKRDGCVIVRDAMAPAAVDALLDDLEPYLQRKKTGEGAFVGFQTKRLHSLYGKSERVADFLLHDKVLEIVDMTLGPWCDTYQLSSNSITAIGPGQEPQALHRGDLLYPIAHPTERNMGCTAFWALSDFTEENGATRIVPGSHLWDDEREPREDETVGAVMPKGSFCVFTSATYHGGGRNTTADRWRVAMFSGYCLGWLRQEQNFYLSLSADEVRRMPERLARLYGFNLHRPFLGWVHDVQDPYDVIHGYEELSSGGADLYAAGETRPVPSRRTRVA